MTAMHRRSSISLSIRTLSIILVAALLGAGSPGLAFAAAGKWTRSVYAQKNPVTIPNHTTRMKDMRPDLHIVTIQNSYTSGPLALGFRHGGCRNSVRVVLTNHGADYAYGDTLDGKQGGQIRVELRVKQNGVVEQTKTAFYGGIDQGQVIDIDFDPVYFQDAGSYLLEARAFIVKHGTTTFSNANYPDKNKANNTSGLNVTVHRSC